MRTTSILLLLPLVKSAEQLPLLTSRLGPVINLGYAAFAGNTTNPDGIPNGPVAFFGNIPYAEPPLGDLRWRAPKQLNESEITHQVSDARNWGPPCLQYPAEVGEND